MKSKHSLLGKLGRAVTSVALLASPLYSTGCMTLLSDPNAPPASKEFYGELPEDVGEVSFSWSSDLGQICVFYQDNQRFFTSRDNPNYKTLRQQVPEYQTRQAINLDELGEEQISKQFTQYVNENDLALGTAFWKSQFWMDNVTIETLDLRDKAYLLQDAEKIREEYQEQLNKRD